MEGEDIYNRLMDVDDGSAFTREPSVVSSSAGTGKRDSWFDRSTTVGDVFGRETSFARTFTEVLGLNYDSEEAWTRRLMDAYAFGEEASERTGDVPLPKGFAQEPRFWRLVLIVSAIGAIMGVVAVGFMNAVDKIPEWWLDNGDYEVQDCQYNAGKPYWIGVTMLGGFLVGLVRWLTDYPESIPGLFRDINDYHVEPKWAPVTFFISAISLSCGASLGPEQALANLGGGMATFISEKVAEFMSKDDRN